jgi:hypothetical protein
MGSYLASYIFCYYQRFMTAKEKLANRHLTATGLLTAAPMWLHKKRQETAEYICETLCLRIRKSWSWREMGWSLRSEDGPENHGRSLR